MNLMLEKLSLAADEVILLQYLNALKAFYLPLTLYYRYVVSVHFQSTDSEVSAFISDHQLLTTGTIQ